MDAHAEMSLRPAVRLGLLFSAICRSKYYWHKISVTSFIVQLLCKINLYLR